MYVWEPWCVGKAHAIQSSIHVSSLFALHVTPHSHRLTGCRGLFELHTNCVVDTPCIAQRLLIQSLLAQVQLYTRLNSFQHWFRSGSSLAIFTHSGTWRTSSGPQQKTRKTWKGNTSTFNFTETCLIQQTPAWEGLSWSGLVLGRCTQISMYSTYLPSSSWGISSIEIMQSRSTCVALCGGSLWTQPKLVSCAGSTVTMQNQLGTSVTLGTSGVLWRSSMRQHFQIISASHCFAQWSNWTSVTPWRICKNLSTGYVTPAKTQKFTCSNTKPWS